jgi:hypothetical protein
LSREQLALLESFLRSRGNLREMERELGISYPTVRGRVEALVRALGFGPRSDADADPESDAGLDPIRPSAPDDRTVRATIAGDRTTILERLARHELTAEEAAEQIRALGRTAR